MGSLGFQAAHHLFNSQPEFSAEMSFFEPRDKLPKRIFSAEILALSIAYELDLANFIQALLDRGIEPLAVKRRGPIVAAGGVLTLMNPLPLAPFVDILLIGDGELLIPRFSRIYRENYSRGKDALLNACSLEPGFWVPALGRPVNFSPLLQTRPSPLYSTIISDDSHFGEMFLVELGRGCPRRCRFCASSHIHNYEYHPPDKIIEAVERNVSPPTAVGLIGSALSDYPDLEQLLIHLTDKGHCLGLSSLRPDAITPGLAGLMVKGGVKTLTVAPEAGTLRLRRIIGKGISDEVIFRSAGYAYEAGISRLKMYYLIGLPGEGEEDLEAIIEMSKRISEMGPRGWLEISVNAFIPKARTPFQWAGFASQGYLKNARARIRKELPGVSFTKRSAAMEAVNAILSAGDENAGLALHDSLKRGISLKQALKERGIDWRKLTAAKADDHSFPWDCFTTGEETLMRGSLFATSHNKI